MRMIVVMVLLLVLTGCDVVFGPEPTATPTPAFPELLPSPSPDIRFPTEISGDIPMGDGVTIPQAAGLPADSGVATQAALPQIDLPDLITVTLRDGRTLNAEAYTGRTGRAGVLLVGTTFEGWGGLPVTLRDLGYTVLTVQGGVSLDALYLSAMLDTLSVQPEVDASRLFVIGVEEGANMALTGCASESRCVGAVVISPVTSETLVSAARAMGPRPILLAASREDGESLTVADAARQAARNAVLQPFEGAGRGTQILSNRPDFVRLIGEWLGR
jgi:predicted esterase